MVCFQYLAFLLGYDVTEVFSPERVNRLAAKFGLTPGASLDLTNGWDFSLAADRNRAWKLVKTSTPLVIIGLDVARLGCVITSDQYSN